MRQKVDGPQASAVLAGQDWDVFVDNTVDNERGRPISPPKTRGPSPEPMPLYPLNAMPNGIVTDGLQAHGAAPTIASGDASRYVSGPLRGNAVGAGSHAIAPTHAALPTPARGVAASKALGAPGAAHMPKLSGLTQVPYLAELQRVGALMPAELMPMVGLVPSAVANAQNTKLGLLRYRLFRGLCEAYQRALAAPSLCSPAEQTRQAIEAKGAQQGLRESVLFLAFNAVEHTSVALTGLPLACRLAGASRWAARLGRVLGLATPWVLAVHGSLHLVRHSLACHWAVQAHAAAVRLANAYAQGEAVASTPLASAHTIEQRLATIKRATERSRRLEASWLLIWSAFELGLMLTTGLLWVQAARPLWAGVMLGASIVASKGLGYLWGDQSNPPFAGLWPPGTPSEGVRVPNAQRMRAFGAVAANAAASLCLHRQREAMQQQQQAIWSLLPPGRRWAMRGLLALSSLPGGGWLLGVAAGRWLTPHIDAAQSALLHGHKQVWRLQSDLLARELLALGHEPHSDFKTQACQARQQEHERLSACLAYVEAADAHADAPALWQLMLRTWQLPAFLDELHRPDKQARAIAELLNWPGRQMQEAQRALDWGGSFALALAQRHEATEPMGALPQALLTARQETQAMARRLWRGAPALPNL